MTETRRPISLFASVALGIGAALLVLLAGGRPAAAAPATVGESKPATANQCFARDDSATGTVYSSTDSAAIRQAVAAAVPNDLVRLAGTCAGVAAQGGTSQTVVITQVLTLIGGLSPADWVDTFPITQPTILDAQGLGRVITASADITIGALTVQYGQSFGGNGGGVYAGTNLFIINPVNFLSNTTLVSSTVNGAMAPSTPVNDGGGVHAEGVVASAGSFNIALGLKWQAVQFTSIFQNNSAYNGAALEARMYEGTVFYDPALMQVDNYISFFNNHSQEYGTVVVFGSGTLDHVNFDSNTGNIGAGLVLGVGGSVQNSTCTNNTATFGTCFFFLGLVPGSVILRNDLVSNNVATNDGAVVYQVGTSFLFDKMRVVNNTVTGAGSVVKLFDSSGSIVNSVFDGNTASNGRVIDMEAYIAATGILRLSFADVESSPVPHLQQELGGRADPLASSTVPTGTAIFASGATVLITDTIIGGYATDLATDGATSSTIVGDYNLFDHTPVISGTNITTGTHSLVGNPLFADTLGHLSAGSPAIDHGINVGINVDLDGNHRPSGAGFDIGAYEFQVAKLFLPLVRR